ncbi:TonB-dependent receptor [candidate division KSB1 bacterium]|nr:TonB-dependent receptor [candidate division KSB1 bacterium]
MCNKFQVSLLKLFLLIVFVLFTSYLNVFAALTGKVAGNISDLETREPLSGANIIIEGTTMGAAADINGDFFILNVPPGRYNIAAKMIGYETMVQQNVTVIVSLTTSLSFSLKQTTIEGAEVVVVAGREVIQTDIASSQMILQGTDVEGMPVNNFKEVLDKQVSMQEVDARGLFMRGQRQSSISMMVDGVETRDNVDDVVYTRINPDELEQVEINAGGFDVSYGNATAGVINLVTREGGKKYNATFDYRQSKAAQKHFGPSIKDYWDRYYLDGWSNQYEPVAWKPALTGNPADTLANRWEIAAHSLNEDDPFRDRPELLKELYKYLMRDEATKYGDKSDYVLSATFGGPVPFLKNTTFFSSYRRENNYYLYPGPLDHFFDQNAMIKITSQLTKNMKLSLNYRYIESTGLNRYDYYRDEASRGDFSTIDPDFQTEKRYLYEGVEQVAWSGYGAWPYTSQIGISTPIRNQYGLTFTHTLSPNTFYEIKLMFNNYHSWGNQPTPRDTTKQVTLTDPADPGYSVTLGGPMAEAPLGFWERNINNPLNWILGGSYNYSENNYVKDLIIRTNLISQINKYNQLNFGFQYNYSDFKKHENRDSPDRLDKWHWHVYPQNAAFWANDKVEFEGLVLDAGLRGDIRIPDEWYDWRHDVWNPLWSGTTTADSNSLGPRYKPPVKMVLAPRLRVAHPIGETAKIFFNWGHYYQEQPYERLYLYYRRDALGQITYGDPELPFQKAIQYEIGYEHNLMDMIHIAVSGYYKDVKNLLMDHVSYRSIESVAQEEPHFYTYGANRYMNSQGLELRLEKIRGQFWHAWINYNVQVFSRGVYGFSSFFEDPTHPPNEWDYTSENVKRPAESRINSSLELYTPDNYGPKVLGWHPASNMNLSFLFWWRQQPCFTYNPDRLIAPYAPLNNKRWKAHWAVNMSLSKRFKIKGAVTPVFYMEVYNLLNTKNMWRGAFNENLSALETYLQILEEEGGEPGDKGDIAEKLIGNNPTRMLPFNGSPWFLYLNPRQIWAGIRLEFNRQ